MQTDSFIIRFKSTIHTAFVATTTTTESQNLARFFASYFILDYQSNDIDTATDAVSSDEYNSDTYYPTLTYSTVTDGQSSDDNGIGLHIFDELLLSTNSTFTKNFIMLCHSILINLLYDIAVPCNISQWTCFNRRCVDNDLVCNDIDNCGDMSDESYVHTQQCGDGRARFYNFL